MAQKKLSTYFGEVGLGLGLDNDPQKIQYFKMMFDTGSCEIWIPNQTCETPICKSHLSYKKSNTYKMKTPNGLQIQYLSGKVQGDMIFDTVTIGDMRVKNQVLGLADQVDIPLLEDVTWDGILGLAYPNSNLKNQGIKTLMENVIEQKSLTKMKEANQFAYYLGPDQGALTFGGADMRYKENMHDEFQWMPITEENYWTIDLINIRKVPRDEKPGPLASVKEKLCPHGCKSIVDTGTYLIYGPQDKINELLTGNVLDSCDDIPKMPDLYFEFKGENGNFELKLTPDQYILHFQVDGEDDCVIGIVPDNVDSGYTIGQVFLKAYYTIFDRENGRIGFVKSNQELDLNIDTHAKDQRFQQKITKQPSKKNLR